MTTLHGRLADTRPTIPVWEDRCSVLAPDRLRLVLVGVGSVVGVLSVCSNLFLFVVLIRTRRHSCSPLVYLSSLSIADVFLSGAYILLFLVNLLMDEWESSLLATAWWSYMRVMLCLSHLAITASAFLIVAAAAERYVTISKIRKEFSRSQRFLIIGLAMAVAVVGKLPVLIEVQVVPNSNCTGVTRWTAKVAEFSENDHYQIYKFWFRNIVTVLLPFACLFFLNIAIIRRLHRQHMAAKLFRFGTTSHKRNIRSATLLLVCVTCTYLASNLLNVVVNVWEFIDRDSLLKEEVRPFYTYSSDLVSFFTVGSSALRLPIYYICNVRIRSEVRKAIEKLFAQPIIRKTTAMPRSTVRYCQSGNGLLIYESRGSEQISRNIGTRMDRLVLAVAIGSVGRRLDKQQSSDVPFNSI